MESINYWYIEDTVESCFKAATTLLDHIPKERGIVTNKNNETFCVRLSDFYSIASKLFSFTAALRGNGEDYSYVGYTESVLKSILSVEDPKRSFHNPSEECTIKKDDFQTALKTYHNTAILLRNLPDEGVIITNSQGEDVTLTSSYINEIASDLLGIVVAYKGDSNDYLNLAYALQNKGVPGDQRADHLIRLIHTYEQASKLDIDNPKPYNYICLNKNLLADLVENWHEQTKEELYGSAIEDGKKAIIIRLKNKNLSSDPYNNRGCSYFELAQLNEDRDEKISLYTRAIVNLRKACRLNGSASDYYYLAASKEFLAEEFHEHSRWLEELSESEEELEALHRQELELKLDALDHYQRALSIENNPIIKKRMQELGQSIS